MVEFQIQLWQLIVGIIALVSGSTGFNYLSSKVANKASMNGFKELVTGKLNSIENKIDKIQETVVKHGEDIAVLKSKTKC